MFKPYEFPLEEKKNLNKAKRTNTITKIEIAKMTDQIDKKLSGVVILDTPLANKSSWILTLDNASEISSSDSEDPNVKAIKPLAN